MPEHGKLGSPLLDDESTRVADLEAIIAVKKRQIKTLEDIVKMKDCRIAELERALEMAERFIAISSF